MKDLPQPEKVHLYGRSPGIFEKYLKIFENLGKKYFDLVKGGDYTDIH